MIWIFPVRSSPFFPPPFRAIAWIVFSPDDDDGRLFFYCTITFHLSVTLIRSNNFFSLSLFPHHFLADLPTLKLELGTNMNPEDIEEGDDVYFECKVNANPSAYKVVWKHNVSIPFPNRTKKNERKKKNWQTVTIPFHCSIAMLFFRWVCFPGVVFWDTYGWRRSRWTTMGYDKNSVSFEWDFL